MSPVRTQDPDRIPWWDQRTIPRSRPASGRAPRAGLVQDAACGTGAQRRLVLDETEHGAMLVQVGPPAPSETARPNGVLPVIPGDGKELVEIGAGNCHSDAMRGTVPVSPDRPTKIVLRRPFESSQYTSIEFGHRCRDGGVRPSMGSVGDAYDNALGLMRGLNRPSYRSRIPASPSRHARAPVVTGEAPSARAASVSLRSRASSGARGGRSRRRFPATAPEGTMPARSRRAS